MMETWPEIGWADWASRLPRDSEAAATADSRCLGCIGSALQMWLTITRRRRSPRLIGRGNGRLVVALDHFPGQPDPDERTHWPRGHPTSRGLEQWRGWRSRSTGT